MADNRTQWRGNFDDVVRVRPSKASGDGYDVGAKPWGRDAYPEDNKTQKTTRSRDSSYSPSRNYGASRSGVARDGYARDSYSDAYERGTNGRRYPPPAIGYGGSGRRRSYDDNDVDGYYERRRVTTYRRDNDRGLERNARSQSRGRDKSRGRRGSSSSRSSSEDHNTALKKWGATFAGAAVGGFGAQRTMGKRDGNWVPTAIGAVIGGLVGREAEKYYYKHKEEKREEENWEKY